MISDWGLSSTARPRPNRVQAVARDLLGTWISVAECTRAGPALWVAGQTGWWKEELPVRARRRHDVTDEQSGKTYPRPPNGFNSLVPRAHGAVAPFTSYVLQSAFAPSHRG